MQIGNPGHIILDRVVSIEFFGFDQHAEKLSKRCKLLANNLFESKLDFDTIIVRNYVWKPFCVSFHKTEIRVVSKIRKPYDDRDDGTTGMVRASPRPHKRFRRPVQG